LAQVLLERGVESNLASSAVDCAPPRSKALETRFYSTSRSTELEARFDSTPRSTALEARIDWTPRSTAFEARFDSTPAGSSQTLLQAL
jgi:hypothetical protein